MDFSFLNKINLNAYVIDEELNLLFINQYAAKRYEDPDQFLGQSIFSCHKEEKSKIRILNMRDEFAQGRKEPFNYSLRKGDKLFRKIISPFYENDEFKGMFEISYLDLRE